MKDENRSPKFVVGRPGISNINRGVFTNISKLCRAFKAKKEDGYKIMFNGAIGFENKTYNYDNLRELIHNLGYGESFALILTKDDTKTLYEITKIQTNTLL